jgi:hypothetical protein
MSSENYFAADQEHAAERKRLALLEQIFDPGTVRHLDAIGIAPRMELP